MRILFATPSLPTITGGGSQRMYYLIKYLSGLNIEIDLLALVNRDDISAQSRNLEALKPYCNNIFPITIDEIELNKVKNLFLLRAYTYYPQYKEKLTSIFQTTHYDLIQVEKIPACRVFCRCKKYSCNNRFMGMWS